MFVFTICSNNYLAQANSLGKSLVYYNPNYQFVIGLVDRKIEAINYNQIHFEIIEVENIGITCFDEMRIRYNISELNTAVKPYFFQYFFYRKKIDTVIYLDPDILVFAPFNDLEKEFEINDIIITPHFTTPINDNKWQAEEDFLNSGLYNLGFIAIKNTINGTLMIDWWAKRLRNKAFRNFSQGLFTDQIWINFVPLFFENVKVFTNPGYNMAYWNLHERVLTKKDDNNYVNSIFLLVFYHFSGYDPLKPDLISKYQNRFSFCERTDIKPLFEKYSKALFENNYLTFLNNSCYFSLIKEIFYKDKLTENIKNVPLYKRFILKIMLKILKRIKIKIDYGDLK